MSKKINIIIERGGATAAPAAPAGIPTQKPKIKIKIRSAKLPGRSMTGWEKFLRKLKAIPGPGKRLYAILSAGALAKGAKDAYIEGYMHAGHLRKGRSGLVTYIMEEGIVDMIPGIGEARWFLSLFDNDESDGTYVPDRYKPNQGWVEKK